MNIKDMTLIDNADAWFTQVQDIETREERMACGPMKDGRYLITPNPATICVGKRRCVKVTVQWS